MKNQLELLLPCPFCGSAVWQPIFTDYAGDSYDPQWTIDCQVCPCSITIEGEDVAGVVEA